MKDRVGYHIDHARAFENERCLKVVEILCRARGTLLDDVSGQSVVGRGMLSVSRISLSRKVLRLLWIDVAYDRDLEALPSSDDL